MPTCEERVLSRIRVYIADDSPDTFAFLKDAAAGAAGWSVAGEARTFDAFLANAPTAEADVWLISSAWLGLMSRIELNRAVSANPEATIIAVTDNKDFAEIKAVLRRGARDVIVAGASADEVRGLVEGHYADATRRRDLARLQNSGEINDANPGKGYIALITGGDGGTGKSFLAAQLAGIVARHANAKTCLVDMDCEYGSLTVALGTTGTRRSLSDLAPVADELEAGQVESVATIHPAGFSLIPAIAANGELDGREASPVPLVETLRILRELFEVVICDIPPDLCDNEIIDLADVIYIITTPDKTGAHCAAGLGQRIPGCRLIINFADRRGAVPTDKMAELCKMAVAAEVPEDAGAGRLFDNSGEILACRTNLAITRSLISIAQLCRPFDELQSEPKLKWLAGLR